MPFRIAHSCWHIILRTSCRQQHEAKPVPNLAFLSRFAFVTTYACFDMTWTPMLQEVAVKAEPADEAATGTESQDAATDMEMSEGAVFAAAAGDIRSRRRCCFCAIWVKHSTRRGSRRFLAICKV